MKYTQEEIIQEKVKLEVIKVVKETEDSYYFSKFPQDKYYIIRWLADGGYHFYPNKDYELPTGFSTQKEAYEYLVNWQIDGIIVKGDKAHEYPVPKRW